MNSHLSFRSGNPALNANVFKVKSSTSNDVMTLIAEGKFNPNNLSYRNLKEEELKLQLMRNKILGGVLMLVIFALLVFK